MSEAISVEGLKKSYKGCCALSLAKARRSPARSPRITQPPPPSRYPVRLQGLHAAGCHGAVANLQLNGGV